MEFCEINFNTLGARGKARPPMATYITPPRSNKQPQGGPSTTTTATTRTAAKPIPTDAEIYTPSGSYPFPSVADPQRMMALAEASYAECPCVMCAQYRAYYAMQVAAADTYANPTAHTHATYPQPQEAPPAVVVGAAPSAGGYHPPTTSQQRQAMLSSAGRYGEPTATPPPSTHTAALPIDTADEFARNCVGRVAELACTAEGQSILMAAMRSQDSMVIDTMVKEIAADVEKVSLDTHGCHILRALREYMNATQTALLVSAFTETLVLNLCTVSQHTRRLLQALFERPSIDLQPIIDVLATNAQYLAATQQGCISLMRIFEHCDATQKAQLMAPLVPIFAHIALDPFGNYVVQCALEHSGKTTAAQYIVTCFTGELLNMSCNKYASNAVEKIIKSCGDVPAVRRLLLDELIYNPAALLQLVQDSFGNFVVQSIIEHMDNPNELKRICDRLRPALLNSPYAAKIDAKLRAKNIPTQHQPQAQQLPLPQAQQPPHSNNNSHHRPQAPRHSSDRRLARQQEQRRTGSMNML